MSKRNPRGLDNIDWVTFSLTLSLIVLGWLMIYSVNYNMNYPESLVDFILHTSVGKQTIWIGISFLTIFIILILDWQIWDTFAYLIYGIAIIMLVLVLFIGTEVNGAASWFVFPGGFSFQPSEFAKFATALVLASTLSNPENNFRSSSSYLIAFTLLAIPMVLILLQPDAGSALVFFSFFILFYRVGLSNTPYLIVAWMLSLFIISLIFDRIDVIIFLLVLGTTFLILNQNRDIIFKQIGMGVLIIGIVVIWYFDVLFYGLIGLALIFVIISIIELRTRNETATFFTLISVGLSSIIVFATSYAFNNFLRPHQQERINVWLNPSKCDPRGSLYNVLQSKLAIGSGGFQGKGFLEGIMTKLNYVPEQSTDFIFCTIGEEQGFIGAAAFIIIFTLLLIRITLLAERQKSFFARNYAYALVGILFIHFVINIGMTIGLFPIIGIPLPFISKGGSSLLFFSIMIGVLLKLDSSRYAI